MDLRAPLAKPVCAPPSRSFFLSGLALAACAVSPGCWSCDSERSLVVGRPVELPLEVGARVDVADAGITVAAFEGCPAADLTLTTEGHRVHLSFLVSFDDGSSRDGTLLFTALSPARLRFECPGRSIGRMELRPVLVDPNGRW